MADMKDNGFLYFLMILGGAPPFDTVPCPFCDHIFYIANAESKGNHIYRCPNCGKDVIADQERRKNETKKHDLPG